MYDFLNIVPEKALAVIIVQNLVHLSVLYLPPQVIMCAVKSLWSVNGGDCVCLKEVHSNVHNIKHGSS